MGSNKSFYEFFTNSNSFGRFRGRFHQGFTKGLQVSWRLWFFVADVSWAAKRFHQGSGKVSPRFHQGSTKLLQVLCAVSGSLGQIRLGLSKGFTEGPTKVSPRFHRGSAKVS